MRDKVPGNGECIVTVRCVQCAELIDVGPFTAAQIVSLGALSEMMVNSTICNTCIGGAFTWADLEECEAE
jgi:hypothetical protein